MPPQDDGMPREYLTRDRAPRPLVFNLREPEREVFAR
jgi:hypothetical protein